MGRGFGHRLGAAGGGGLRACAVDASGNSVVAGMGASDWPQRGALQSFGGSMNDIVVARFIPVTRP